MTFRSKEQYPELSSKSRDDDNDRKPSHGSEDLLYEAPSLFVPTFP